LLLAAPALASVPANSDEVDLLLVLAADISHSMQEAELRMQRQGYASALRDKEVLDAMCSGPCGAIGVVYFEWSGIEDQRVLLPWTRIGNAGEAAACSERLAAAPQRVGSWTSISGAIAHSRRLIAAAPFRSDRSVVDISGDGENNSGPPVETERDLAVEEGLTINGLPILRGPSRAASVPGTEGSPLEEHYRRLVTGGPGAFVLPAESFDVFPGAIRRKLVLEIAGLQAPQGLRSTG
jgi:hypothetical protein